MTREAYKSIKYELCNLNPECTNLAKEFTTAVFLDVNRWINLSLVERYMKLGSMKVYSSLYLFYYCSSTSLWSESK